MARVTGPLHSDDASGTLNGSMTFSKWKGRSYVRTTITPHNPQTAKQVGVRAMMRFLAQAWKSIAPTPQASWAALGTSRMISAFNAFVGVALTNWQTLLAPQQTYNATRATTPLTVTTQTAAGSAGAVTLTITPSGATAIWGVAIFRGTTGFTPSFANCIAVLPTSTANPLTYVDSPLDAATYYYRSAVFNTDGILGTIHAETTGTAS